jgi:hypothetical protein
MKYQDQAKAQQAQMPAATAQLDLTAQLSHLAQLQQGLITADEYAALAV